LAIAQCRTAIDEILTPHERRVFVTLALTGVQLVVLAERSRTRTQSSEATVKTTKPPEKTLRFLGYAGQRTASAAWGGEPASGVVSRYLTS
jgi:hypothetical protein